MATRQRLPDRRCSVSFNFEHRGLGFTCSYSRFADGRIGELFITNHKVASAVDVDARDPAIILSFALQFGADISAIGKALCRDPRGNPTPRSTSSRQRRDRKVDRLEHETPASLARH